MPSLRCWWQHLQFRVNLLFTLALLLCLVTVISVVLHLGKDVLVQRDRQLVDQTSARIVAELNSQLSHAETLARTIAGAAATVPATPQQMNTLLHRLLADSRYPDFIIGGGIWPEPGQLIPEQAKASLFWGRNSAGILQFFDDYNLPDEPAYHRTEWYTPVRYLNQQNCYWSRSYSDPYTLVPMVTCSAAIERDNRFWGVATVDVKLAGLTDFLAARLEDIGGYGVVLDRNENVIALPRVVDDTIVSVSLTGQGSPDFRADWKKEVFGPLKEAMTADRQQPLKGDVDPLALRLMGETDDIELAEAQRIAGYLNQPKPQSGARSFMIEHDPLLSEIAQVNLLSMPQVDWSLAIVVPDRVAIANAERLAWQGMAALIGSALLGMVFVGYQVHRSLVAPLRTMIRRLQKGGQKSVRLDEDAGFELGQLAKAYNGQQQALLASQTVVNESRLCLQSMMDNAIDGIIMLDPEGRIQHINPSAARLLQESEQALRGVDFCELFSQEARHQVVEGLRQIINAQQQTISPLETELQLPSMVLYIELSMSGWQAAGRSHITVFIRDITERKAAEQRVHYMATRDSLTGLYNRYQLAERLAQGLKVAQRHKQKLAVLFIDLDHFKDVNDRLGHQAGDQLLTGVAERLQMARRADDSVARLGGDEFAVVLQNVNHTRDVGMTAEQIVHALLKPFWIDGSECRIGASVGITLYPDNGQSAEELLRQADSAMYLAKAEGRSTWRFYAPEQHQKQQQRRQMLSEVAQAVNRQQLLLNYQPIVQANTSDHANAPVTFEALLRWHHPELGIIPPSTLVPLAEEAGLMVDIGRWVLEQTCRQLQLWQSEQQGICRLSVNVSPQQLQQGNFEADLLCLLERYQLSAEQIRLEITESMLISDSCAHQLHQLDRAGAQLVVDDFGTGYSSLSYLQKFPVRLIKLDRSFVADVETSASSQSICQAVIGLAHNLGMEVVAEGVETVGQQQMMEAMGCDQLQGNRFSAPMPADQVAEWLRHYRHAQGENQITSQWDI